MYCGVGFNGQKYTYSPFFKITLFVFVAAGAGAYAQQPATEAEVTFHVAWYDVGKAALDGLDGVKKVDKGIQRNRLWFRETNTVVYDPQQITVDEMKSALQKSGTYKGILEPE